MWHLLRRNRDDLVAARAFFRRAIELDPAFATPRAALALSCFFQITHGFTNDRAASLDELFAEASQAVALDPKDALGHTSLGLAFMERQDHSASLAEHQIAVSINPNSSLARYALGYGLHRAERLQEALEQFDAALRLSPRDPGLWSYLTLKASTLYRLRRSIIDLIWPYVHLAAALGQLGRGDEALAAVEERRRRRPGLTVSDVRSWPHNRSRSEESLVCLRACAGAACRSDEPRRPRLQVSAIAAAASFARRKSGPSKVRLPSAISLRGHSLPRCQFECPVLPKNGHELNCENEAIGQKLTHAAQKKACADEERSAYPDCLPISKKWDLYTCLIHKEIPGGFLQNPPGVVRC
jgi:tetratricopeptide (TPR) repeat protein